jgi:hypothetical protein
VDATPSAAASDQEYVASLASVTEHDGTLYVWCFSFAAIKRIRTAGPVGPTAGRSAA